MLHTQNRRLSHARRQWQLLYACMSTTITQAWMNSFILAANSIGLRLTHLFVVMKEAGSWMRKTVETRTYLERALLNCVRAKPQGTPAVRTHSRPQTELDNAFVFFSDEWNCFSFSTFPDSERHDIAISFVMELITKREKQLLETFMDVNVVGQEALEMRRAMFSPKYVDLFAHACYHANEDVLQPLVEHEYINPSNVPEDRRVALIHASGLLERLPAETREGFVDLLDLSWGEFKEVLPADTQDDLTNDDFEEAQTPLPAGAASSNTLSLENAQPRDEDA
eukprot:4867402-Pleurochrysis_carterae.AAC.1